MNAPSDKFVWPARLLHWLMAVLLLAMLLIGAGMVSTVSDWHRVLEAVHRPLGAIIWLLVLLRLAVRLRNPPPPLPPDLHPLQRFAALASHWLLYGLIFALPLVGWAMLSAGGFPVMLGDSLRLPAILPADTATFACLRVLHRWLAYALMATILVHVAAALHHACVRRDGVLRSMV